MACFSAVSLRVLNPIALPKVTKVNISWKKACEYKWKKYLCIGGAITATIFGIATPVLASELELHPPGLPWSHNGMLASYDHASMRRGYQVYKEVCAACHSMKYMSYRQLINHLLTEDEAKADAAEQQYEDGPDDTGKMFMRPGRLTDPLPSPYANSEAARAANNGALPPDLTFIAKGRHAKEDYIFHLLTSYCDPPPGRDVAEGQYYNPYFPGGALGMARALYDELIEYQDGTPATTSQMAKDVSTFLTWTSDRNHDQRKLILFKSLIVMAAAAVISGIYKRKRWSILKSRKIMYKNRPPPRHY